MRIIPLATGAELRVRGPVDGPVVLAANGGAAPDRPGTWSATVEYVVGALAERFPQFGFAEVRYRIRSWRRLAMCTEDARAALDVVATDAAEVILLGYSMGGAVVAQLADHPLVRDVIGLAPWFPQELDLGAMEGRRLTVVHGTLDRYLPGVPGVSPESSRVGFDRILALGGQGTYTLLRGATHAVALRAPWGGLIPLPRARRWVDLVARALAATVDGGV